MKILFFLSACAWAQIEQPQLGIMLDRAGVARPVWGVSASVTLGTAVATEVVSMACSRRWCIASTAAGLVSWGNGRQWRSEAPAGTAVFAFSGDSAYVYSSGQLAKWREGTRELVGVDVSGEILSMRVVDGALEFAVRRDDGTWIVRDGNAIVAALPEATGPVMLLDRAVLFATDDAVILRRTDASEMRFPAAGAESFVVMGDGLVQIRARDANYALRIEAGREKLFLLPEIQ
ncbi:MAG TPA: hypothetical protein VNX18_08895 [Bryobacteraceae bacterium]|nr:hypothetical protein [Bryobacteraceae bacterium]